MSRVHFLVLALLFAGFGQVHAESVRRLGAILPGLLYRSGGPKGTGAQSMSGGAVERLCDKGYSAVFYLYPTEKFRNKGQHNCGTGSTDYLASGYRQADARPAFERVYQAVNNGEGPVLVHCWNGRHASGEVAAYALKQFCGYSADDAVKYFISTLQSSERKSAQTKFKGIINRIKNFDPYEGLILTASQRSQYCNPENSIGD